VRPSSPPPFSLLLITDWAVPDFKSKLKDALSVGSGIALQQRNNEVPASAFFEQATLAAKLCDNVRVPLFINRRLDVALALQAHLHLPSNAAPTHAVRALLPANRWLSVALHSYDEAVRAQGADFALLSPVFRPNSKPLDQRPTLGVDGFNQLASHVPAIAIALGGIRIDNVHLLPPKTPVAVMGAVWNSPDCAAAVRRLLEAM
jgi:thiamine-phosphate pyrophosphorylase